MKKIFFTLFIFPIFLAAQFAPAAGQAGSTAIKKDSSIIVNWAKTCFIKRGFQDISDQSLGETSVGDSSSVIGPADGVTVASLGDRGVAILTFWDPITNLAGPDFCVFENSFDANFLELAFVEVSSDGINFTRFPATCNVQNTVQIGPFDATSDPSKINNLAGKYIGGYGVPFDLQELAGTNGLDLDAITHVKIVDVVGCIQSQYASVDQNNNTINDPWATAFPSGGFDLEAVGVIHQVPTSIKANKSIKSTIHVWPTVTIKSVHIDNELKEPMEIVLKSMEGKTLVKEQIGTNFILDLSELAEGVYILEVHCKSGSSLHKIIKQN